MDKQGQTVLRKLLALSTALFFLASCAAPSAPVAAPAEASATLPPATPAQTATPAPTPSPRPGPFAGLEAWYTEDMQPAPRPSLHQSGAFSPIALSPDDFAARFAAAVPGNDLVAFLLSHGAPPEADWMQGLLHDEAPYRLELLPYRLPEGGAPREAALGRVYSGNKALAFVWERAEDWTLVDIWHLPPGDYAEGWIRPIELGGGFLLAVDAFGDRGTGIQHRDIQLYDLQSRGFIAAFHGDCRETVRESGDSLVYKLSQSSLVPAGDTLCVQIRQQLVHRDCSKGNSPDAPEIKDSEKHSSLCFQYGEAGLFLPHGSPAPAEAPKRDEAWFLGDWAGVLDASWAETEEAWTDFGAASSRFPSQRCCLLHIYENEGSYEAALGSSLWEVAAYGADGFVLVCTRSSAESGVPPDSIYSEPFSFREGQSIVFHFEEEVKSSVPGAQVPETDILFGAASPENRHGRGSRFLLSRLPSGRERPWGSGEYPCWFGGYEAMEGPFKGMFSLGMNENGYRSFGQLLEGADGTVRVVGVSDGDNPDSFYGERALPHTDLLRFASPGSGAPPFPFFFRHTPSAGWRNVSAERGAYYANSYIPSLEAEIETLSQMPQDIWTRREAALLQAYMDCAQEIAQGGFAHERAALLPHIPAFAQAAGAQRFPVTLAGIAPGDTLEDAQKLHELHPLREDEAPRFGLEGAQLGKTRYFTDGKGLLLTRMEDGRIGSVRVCAPGYDSPDGRQTDDLYERDKLTYHAKDAVIEFGHWDLEDGVDAIGGIRMDMVLDRVWDEVELDMDGDGDKERLTLSGRSLRNGPEIPTALGDPDTGFADALDFGTRTRLRIYEGETLRYEAELPLYSYYGFTPRFLDKLRTDAPGEARIVCETGGTGLEIPAYRLRFDGKTHELTFLGNIDIYS